MSYEELPRDRKGVRLDVRGARDLAFNNWHRKFLKRDCYVTDVDFLEYRFEHGRLVLKAIIEAKEWHVTQPKYVENSANFKALKRLAEKAEILFYYIWYKVDENNDILRFKIWDIFNEQKSEAIELSPQELKIFIEQL